MDRRPAIAAGTQPAWEPTSWTIPPVTGPLGGHLHFWTGRRLSWNNPFGGNVAAVEVVRRDASTSTQPPRPVAAGISSAPLGASQMEIKRVAGDELLLYRVRDCGLDDYSVAESIIVGGAASKRCAVCAVAAPIPPWPARWACPGRIPLESPGSVSPAWLLERVSGGRHQRHWDWRLITAHQPDGYHSRRRHHLTIRVHDQRRRRVLERHVDHCLGSSPSERADNHPSSRWGFRSALSLDCHSRQRCRC